MNNTDTPDDRKAFIALWRSWALTAGFGTGLAVVSLWLPRLWFPLLAFTLGMILFGLVRHNRNAEHPRCYVLLYLGIYVQMWSGAIVAAIELWYSPSIFSGMPGHQLPPEVHSYIGALVVYPVALAIALWAEWRKYRLHFCVDCRIRYGTPAERGFLGKLYCQEGTYQRHMMLWVTGIETAAAWSYYFLRYDNSYINRQDIFFFAILPGALYVVSIIYLAVRYISLCFYYDRDIEGTVLRRGDSTTVRFIIISGNEFFLHEPDSTEAMMPGDDRIDTPARCVISYRRNVDVHTAREWLRNIIDMESMENVTVRFMYRSQSASVNSNTFHFLVFAPSHELVETGKLSGSWYSIYDIKKLIDDNECSPMLASEIHRLYTIAMAWKTYDRHGHRLYKIRHYRPTFRVSDIPKWDVDYSDSHWLYVAQNNEDHPFYKWRNFWRRYISGVND